MDWGYVAEDADAYQELAPSVERDARSEVVLIHGPTNDPWSNLATRIRFGHDDVAARVAGVRAWFRERKVEEFRWLVGPSATPAGAVTALIELGANPDDEEPELTAMVLDHAPPPALDTSVREVNSRADFGQLRRIHGQVFGPGSGPSPEELDAEWAAMASGRWARAFLAEVDGETAAYGVMRRTDAGPWLLAGGVTLPAARRRGAYRALVRARWDAAEAMGAPVLVTQAQALSRPILERLGFKPCGRIVVLVDHASMSMPGPALNSSGLQ